VARREAIAAGQSAFAGATYLVTGATTPETSWPVLARYGVKYPVTSKTRSVVLPAVDM
jgi:hypothetical protein